MMTSSNGNISASLALCAGNYSPHKDQWRGALMFPLICAWVNGWLNNREDVGLRGHRAHNDVTVMHTLIASSLPVIDTRMLCTAQLGGPVLKAFGRVQKPPFQLADKSPMIKDQHTAGGSISQLSQLAKLWPWFWHYNKLFCFLSNQIKGLYHFSNPIE